MYEHKNRGAAAVTIDSYVLFVLQMLSNRSRLHENRLLLLTYYVHDFI